MTKQTLVAGLLLLLISVVTGCQTQQPVGSVAFSRLTGDHWQLWAMQPDGSGAKQLTASPSDKRYPAWGKDSQKLFFRDNNNRAFFIDLPTGEEKRILQPLGLIGSLAESPSGDKLVVVRFRSELMDSSDLWTVEMNSGNRRILTRDVGLQYDPAWSPDGKKIAYISGHGYQTHELYIIDSNGKNKQRLTANKALELLPAFSPDGKRIAYVSDITGDYEIWIMDIDGSNARQLTDSDGIDTRPCWSPDASKILFISNRSDQLHLWIINSDGSNPRQLTRGSPSIEPAWRRKSD